MNGSSYLKARSEPTRVQYVPPEGSAETEPPYDSPEIVKWMILNGRRVKRHDSYADAWAAARDNILRATAFMLSVIAVIMSALAVLFGGVVAGSAHFISPAAGLISGVLIAGVVLGVILAAMLATFWPRSFGDPLDMVRDRYDLSGDEEALSFAVVGCVLVPLCLIVNYTLG